MKMKKLEACFKAQARGSTLRWFIRTYKTPCCKALAPALGGLTDAQRSSCDPTRVCGGHLIAIENLRDVLKKRELMSAASGSGATSQSAQPVPRPHVRSGLKTKSAIARADPAVLANAARQREAAKRQSDALDAQRRRAGARQRAEQMVPTAIGGVGLAESMTAAVGHTLADDQRDAHKRTTKRTNARKHAKRAAKRAEARAIKEREERVEEATRQAIEASMAEQSTREEEEMHAALAEVEAAKREAQALGYEVVTSVMRAVGACKIGAHVRALGLTSMGYSTERCCAALQACGLEADVSALATWLIDVPEEEGPGVSVDVLAGDVDVSEEMMELQDFAENMNIAREVVDAAVVAAYGDISVAMQGICQRLFAAEDDLIEEPSTDNFYYEQGDYEGGGGGDEEEEDGDPWGALSDAAEMTAPASDWGAAPASDTPKASRWGPSPAVEADVLGDMVSRLPADLI